MLARLPFSAEPDPWLASVHHAVMIDQDQGSQCGQEASIEEVLGHDLTSRGQNLGTSRSAVPTPPRLAPIWNRLSGVWHSEAAHSGTLYNDRGLGSMLYAFPGSWGPQARNSDAFDTAHAGWER